MRVEEDQAQFDRVNRSVLVLGHQKKEQTHPVQTLYREEHPVKIALQLAESWRQNNIQKRPEKVLEIVVRITTRRHF